MGLEDEIRNAAREIYTDGYDMSLGEIVSLYRDSELIINPAYQRLFRWDETRKTRFIESLLLGIPVPSIFVFQNADGTWELVDGLQRLSTVLEFMGLLKGPSGSVSPASTLEATTLLPSLSGKVWDENSENSIGRAQQISLKRARMRVEILKKESDPQVKYELFQRLNTGGIELSDQEVRSSIMLMVSPSFYQFMESASNNSDLIETTAITDKAVREGRHSELILRLLAYKFAPYSGKLDVNEYLDESMLKLMSDGIPDEAKVKEDLQNTFSILNRCMGSRSFKKFDGEDFLGSFSIAAFESIAFGIFFNVDKWSNIDQSDLCEKLSDKIKLLWQHDTFILNSGAGVRGTTRITNLLPFATEYFVP